jgi:xylulokinase
VTILLGLDVGTSGVRGAAFDASGARLAEHAIACPYSTPRAGWAEADPEAWWEAVRAVTRQIETKIPLASIDAIGVTGQAPTAVLVDGDARVVRPAILWLDTRADREAKEVDRALGDGVALKLGGNALHAYYLGAKLAWLRANDGESLERASHVLASHAFVVLRLTGKVTGDYSSASLCAPLYDAGARAWSPAGARAVGIEPRLLPPLFAAHTVVGAVTREASSATGLRRGTPVVAGGGDFAASALGAGVVDEGEACLMLGTAGNLLMPLRDRRFDARLINSHHVGCDRFLTLGGTLSGALQEWFKSAMANGASFETLDAEAAATPPGANGLVLLPYLQGERTPIWNVAARGVFFGLDLSHGRGHLYRAVLEAIALSFRHCQEIVGEHGVALAEVIAANGGGKSALFRQILCDALGVPLAYVPSGGGTLAGAAVLAGLGVGTLANGAAKA